VKRRDLLTDLAGTAFLPRMLHAQQNALPVIGWLSPLRSDQPLPQRDVVAFREGLADSGFVEGRNVRLEYRWAEGNADRLPALAADLVARKVDLIATQGGDIAAVAAKNATSTIPIVFNSFDPVAAGLVASLARPGGNLTGVAMMTPELTPKLLELLLELAPQAGTVALLESSRAASTEHIVPLMQQAARAKAVRLQLLNAAAISDFDAAFAELDRLHAGGLIVGLAFGRHLVAPMALRHRMPAIAMSRDFPVDGGLASYGPSLASIYRLKGAYAGRILNGEKPADLPAQQPTKFELVINLKTAKALGLTIPQSLLQRADEVIE
jgi:putative tryptophan/tyrosine transport system substrate-binding protein